MAFSLDGTRAYVSAEIGGTITVIDVTKNHTVLASINLGLDSRPVELIVDPSGKNLFVAGGGTSAIYVIDTATNKVTTTIKEKMGRRPWGVTMTPDGKKLYTANGLSDSVSVIDPTCMCVLKNIAVGRGARQLRGRHIQRPLRLAGAEPADPVGLDDADVDPGEVAVADAAAPRRKQIRAPTSTRRAWPRP